MTLGGHLTRIEAAADLNPSGGFFVRCERTSARGENEEAAN
jgi:hypothetical protein